jgi:hypothetical protein
MKIDARIINSLAILGTDVYQIAPEHHRKMEQYEMTLQSLRVSTNLARLIITGDLLYFVSNIEINSDFITRSYKIQNEIRGPNKSTGANAQLHQQPTQQSLDPQAEGISPHRRLPLPDRYVVLQ